MNSPLSRIGSLALQLLPYKLFPLHTVYSYSPPLYLDSTVILFMFFWLQVYTRSKSGSAF